MTAPGVTVRRTVETIAGVPGFVRSNESTPQPSAMVRNRRHASSTLPPAAPNAPSGARK